MACSPGSNCCASCKSAPAPTAAANPYVPTAEYTADIGKGLGLAGAAAGAYHGYKRTGSVGWALLYSLAGGLFPIFAGAVMIAQGFGKRK